MSEQDGVFPMVITRTWLRIELRLRWRSLVVIALLIAVCSGTVLAAVAGARRGDSAQRRLSGQSLPATAMVLPLTVDWDDVRSLPGVLAVATLTASGLSVEGVADDDPTVTFLLPEDDRLLRTVERPVLLRGRLPDPSRPDEAAATSGFLANTGKELGDEVGIRPRLPDRQAGTPSAGFPDRVRIVAVLRSPILSDEPASRGQIVFSPSLMSRYRAIGGQPDVGALVRLQGGASALPGFRADLARLTGRTDLDAQDLAESVLRRQRLIRFESRFLQGFAVAGLLAALFLVGQSVVRHLAGGLRQLQMLQALGLTRRQAVAAATAGPLIAGVAGAAAGGCAAVVASRWFPIGSAAAYEPAPGIDVDWVVVGAGSVVILLIVAAGAAAAAWWGMRSEATRAPARRSASVTLLAGMAAPVPAIVGTRFALEPGRGRTAVPARAAVLGATVGVLGVMASFTFSSGISEAAANPRRFGQTAQLAAYLSDTGKRPAAAGALLAAAAADPDVVGVADCRTNIATATAGHTATVLYSCRPVGDPSGIVLVSGRLPQAASEIVLGPETAARLGSDLADTIELTGTRQRTMSVTGIGFVPESWLNSHADGGWVTAEAFDELFDTSAGDAAYVEVRPGTAVKDVQARLNGVSATLLGGTDLSFQQLPPPARIGEFRGVRGVPLVLGIFLALLAVGAVGHALTAAVRRRRHDLAVLRALGMTRRQSRGVVVVQASVLALVGLLFGVPLGVALGRTLWRLVADYTPLQYEPPVAVWALLLVGPLTLLAANLMAVWPGQQAARLHIGNVLRAE